MKKLFFAAAFAAIGLVGVNAQTGIEGSVHVGVPVGDASKVSSFNLGADVAYLHPVANNFKVGGKVGYDHFFGKSGINDFGFIPLAATAKYEFGKSNIFLGGDAGYAFSTEKHIDGGFFYQPKIGYSAATWDLYAGFKGIVISNDIPGLKNFNANTVSIGLTYKF